LSATFFSIERPNNYLLAVSAFPRACLCQLLPEICYLLRLCIDPDILMVESTKHHRLSLTDGRFIFDNIRLWVTNRNKDPLFGRPLCP
jgi:hypothetical protein